MITFAYLIEPPFNDRDRSGKITGCDVELARTVLAMTGHGDIAFAEAEFSQLLPGLDEGRWHMTTGLFATEERRKIAAFSRPIWALPDGLLVARGNPLGLTGYRSIAERRDCTLAVIRDQLQHRTAVTFDVTSDRILICETYREAAEAVLTGHAAAYASVARAHSAFIEQAGDLPLDVVQIPADEKEPAYGCFGFGRSNDAFRNTIDEALSSYLGSGEHRAMMRAFGFTDREIDIVAP